MFDAIVSRIANAVRNTLRAVGAATQRAPWFAPLAILALLLVW